MSMPLSVSLKTILLGVVFACVPFISQAEYIESFDAEINVSEDSSFLVSESIEYVFDSAKHGIFRFIPTIHPVSAERFYEKRVVDIVVVSVLLDGVPVNYELENRTNEVYLKIGDPNVTITGLHKYEIEYVVTGGLSYFDSGEVDLYWNITGTDWPVIIKSAKARLLANDDLFLEKQTCYSGLKGAQGTCKSDISGNREATFSAENLLVGEGLTVAQSINPTMVKKVELIGYRWGLIFGLLFFIGLLYGVFRLYKYEVKHRTGRTIVAQYEPYPGVKPMYTGLLFDGRLDPRDITAGIVYLAEQGYLKISKVEKKVLFFEVDDYEVTLLKDIDDNINNFEREVLKLIFGNSSKVGRSVTLSQLKDSLSKRKENTKIMKRLNSALKKDLVDSGFYEKFFQVSGLSGLNWEVKWPRFGRLGIGLVFVVYVVIILALSAPLFISTIVFLIVLFTVLERRRTRLGYEALDHLKGFKLFLEVTDAERFKFHNAPDKNPDLFMVYLPYAIAFGVEKQWAETFKNIVLDTPEWYGNGNVRHFDASGLAVSMNAFSSALSSASTPPSSGGSSGGGGFSGGGGGGGGGGSW